MADKIATSANRPVDGDLAKRILRQAVIATTGLGTDGAMVIPRGIMLQRYLSTPIVTKRHINDPNRWFQIQPSDADVVARSLTLQPADLELMAEIQFADTGDGRDYAWLYGLNPDMTPYMRSWSIEGPIVESQSADWAAARKIAADYWDPDFGARMQKKMARVTVVTRFELAVVAAVPLGADRGALTRAQGAGCRIAGELLARMDLDAASNALAAMKENMSGMDARVAHIENTIQALRRDGAAAAAQGDSAAVLIEVRRLAAMLDRKRPERGA
jgi:hypothetical protein